MNPVSVYLSRRALLRSQWFDAATISQLQAQRSRELIEYAYSCVPYYRQLFDGIGLKPRHIKNVDDLKNIEIPTLVLAGGVDPLLNANLDDYRRLPNACLQVFFRAAHEIGIHETEGVAETIHQFMQHGALNAATLKARKL